MQSLRQEIARYEGEHGAIGGGKWAGWDLARLGHAELGEAAPNGGWSVAPPVLALRPLGGTPSGVLCGARTQPFMARLEEAAHNHGARLAITAQTGAPDLVELEADQPAALSQAAKATGIAVQPRATRAIIAAAGPVRGIPLPPVGMPIGQGWSVFRYSPSKLQWVASSVSAAGEAASGLFRFRSDFETRYVLRDSAGTWQCAPDVGKYRVLTRRHKPLAYSATTQTLRVAARARPPPLVERALVIASGRLPAFDSGWLFYAALEPADAAAAAANLGQKLH